MKGKVQTSLSTWVLASSEGTDLDETRGDQEPGEETITDVLVTLCSVLVLHIKKPRLPAGSRSQQPGQTGFLTSERAKEYRQTNGTWAFYSL